MAEDEVLVVPPAVLEPVPPDPAFELALTPPKDVAPPDDELLLEPPAPPLEPPSLFDELLPPLPAALVVVFPPETLLDELPLPPLPPPLEEELVEPAVPLVLLEAEPASSLQAPEPRLAKARNAETNETPNFEFMNDSLELASGILISSG